MKEHLNTFEQYKTPFFWYDVTLLENTLKTIKTESDKYGYHVHYAVKANANQPILRKIEEIGFGADCVSGNEVLASVQAGFSHDKIVFAGVGKSDDEINIGLDTNIFCFNVESIPEMEVINELAAKKGKIAKIALRINPNVNAATHHYITTGLQENKFGINMWEMEDVLSALERLKSLQLIGIHFHIGSQINNLDDFKGLCLRANEIQEWFYKHQIIVDHVNVGGGLGIDYDNPDANAIPNFEAYFKVFSDHLKLRPKQELHFELGRAVVGQCGSLITKVLYVKKGVETNFAIVDAGMTELIRPALYQATHKIENLTSNKAENRYDVVGPICESSDCFGKALMLPETQRNDIIALRSTGAYGEVMASQYNLRTLAKAYYSK
ncbi:MAG: diaminopimelate decarboxylase [Salinivirgaceae bacterium]|jgi:diaminopimelate decarboxylase|nr:diaminopimelate decarboxylase [Salinivirgaceae bacterium]